MLFFCMLPFFSFEENDGILDLAFPSPEVQLQEKWAHQFWAHKLATERSNKVHLTGPLIAQAYLHEIPTFLLHSFQKWLFAQSSAFPCRLPARSTGSGISTWQPRRAKWRLKSKHMPLWKKTEPHMWNKECACLRQHAGNGHLSSLHEPLRCSDDWLDTLGSNSTPHFPSRFLLFKIFRDDEFRLLYYFVTDMEVPESRSSRTSHATTRNTAQANTRWRNTTFTTRCGPFPLWNLFFPPPYLSSCRCGHIQHHHFSSLVTIHHGSCSRVRRSAVTYPCHALFVWACDAVSNTYI